MGGEKMKSIKNWLTNIYLLYGVILFLLLLNIGCGFLIFKKQTVKNVETEDILAVEEIEQEEEPQQEKNILHVDIKGYVKNPGVYEVEEGARINDVIRLAGGLKKDGTTENINLSKKIIDEAMIVISSKADLKKATSCPTEATSKQNSTVENNETSFGVDTPSVTEVAPTTSPQNTKISLNTATKEELMTLSGIGEKTAEKIIEYRTNEKFVTIEDIKKVSGIGDALFEKIKDFITI